MEREYLLIAEHISYKHEKLSIINTWNHFMAYKLPTTFNFDMVFICGPGWKAGDYDLKFKVKFEHTEPLEIGNLTINILDDNYVFNAMAPNLSLQLDNISNNLTIIVERDGEEVFTREFKIFYLQEQNTTQEAESAV